MTYHEYWNEIHGLQAELHQFLVSYWNDYSNAGTWQFWTILFLLVLPLIILYFAVDRSRIFELFFFGFCRSFLLLAIPPLLPTKCKVGEELPLAYAKISLTFLFDRTYVCVFAKTMVRFS